MMTSVRTFLGACALMLCAGAAADITVGVTLSISGPASTLGVPGKNTIALMPASIGEHKVRYVVLDDKSDPAQAAANARRFASEDKVDLIIGSNTTPNSLAMIDLVVQAQVPMISLAASSAIVDPVDAKRRWVFKTPQNDITMALAVAEHMAATGIRTVGVIGFGDAYGEGYYQSFTRAAELKRLNIVAHERFGRVDTSVAAQVERLIAAKPDAVFIIASGTPAVLPQRTLREKGFAGRYYQTHGVGNSDFLRVGGKDVEGTFLPAGPVLVANQLPADHPVRLVGQMYVTKYETVYGQGTASTFGAHAWDAGLLMQQAAYKALRSARPGTPEFRAALREALESTRELPGAHGVFSMSPKDHLGLDQRSRVMVKIENGAWKYVTAQH